eukprot:gene7982-8180_t
MQTIVKSGTTAVSNPFLGSRMTYRVAAAPAPVSTTAFRQSRRNTPERLELKKYNPHLQRYTVHREVK